MELQQIKHFLKLADELHFWNTSRKMNITQSALSRQIKSLEDELNVQLFVRNKRNVKLTTAGEFLKIKWGAVMDELKFIHQFARKIDQGETGSIRISHPESISSSFLPDLLLRISNRLPELHIELTTLVYENQQEFLKEYKIDIAFTRDINKMDNINSKKVATDNLALVVPDNHPYQIIEDLSLETLKQQKFIMPCTDVNSSYKKFVQQVFDAYQLKPTVLSYESDFGSTTIALISKGLGVAILPYSYSSHGYTGVRFIKLPYEADLYINWRTDDHNPVLKNVLELI